MYRSFVYIHNQILKIKTIFVLYKEVIAKYARKAYAIIAFNLSESLADIHEPHCAFIFCTIPVKVNNTYKAFSSIALYAHHIRSCIRYLCPGHITVDVKIRRATACIKQEVVLVVALVESDNWKSRQLHGSLELHYTLRSILKVSVYKSTYT